MAGVMNRWMQWTAVAALGISVAIAGGCQNELKAEVEQLRAENAQLANDRASLEQRLAQEQAMRQQAEAQLAAAPVWTNPQPAPQRETRPAPQPRDTVITIAGDVNFAPGQATLTAAGRRELDAIARRIQQNFPNNRIRVEGYTDRTPITRSNWASNEALSKARAEAVQSYLVSKGISRSRIEAVGRGSTNLKATDAASRRVEIHILGN
jgi:outer membrane protein OmpA-like peptidoglycan-associated protein